MTLPNPSPARRPALRRAVAVWAAAAAAYVVAVLNRSSFGVAGLEAAERYGTGASTLATFVVAQLVVYAGLQVPVGVALDRFGSRRLIATGALLMSAGQLALALSTSTGPALAARVLIGAGDALTFVSVIRLLPAWFPLRRVPLVSQLTGVVGLLGQVGAAVPLVLVLHGSGWTTAFVAASVLGLLSATAVLLVVRDAPPPVPGTGRPAATGAGVHADEVPLAVLVASSSPEPGAGHAVPPPGRRHGVLRPTLREPGTWLGFWVHVVGAYSNNTMVLLWAFPFLVSGQGRTAAEVSALLTVNVVASIVAGPVVGHVSGHHPDRRLRLVVVVAVAVGLAWAGLLLPAEPLPIGALAAFLAVVAVGTPASLVGLDIARAHNPRERMGTATGVANSGGFLAALVTMLAVGLVLDARGGGGGGVASPLVDYRVALSCALVTWLVGVVGLALSARRVRAGR